MKLHLSPDLTLPADAVTQTFAILAKRGVGKTYTAAVMAEEMLAAALQVVVVDPIGVWWGLRAAANGRDEGLAIVVMGGDHGDVPLEATGGELVADFVVESGRSVVLDLSLFRKGEMIRFMTAFTETIYRRNRAPLHLLVDEADAFAPQKTMHGEGAERLLGAMEDIVRRGRARGLGCTLITQRAAVLNKNVLTQIEVLVCLRTIAPQDRDAVDAWINVHGTVEQRAELMASLPSLPVGEAWFWSPGWLDLFQRVKVRKRETFDSSATPKAGEKIATPKKLKPVDLAELREKMAATIEKAKAEDPRELRREIGELKRQLTAEAQKRGEGAKVDAVRKPLLDAELLGAIQKAKNEAFDAIQQIRDATLRLDLYKDHLSAAANILDRVHWNGRAAIANAELQPDGAKLQSHAANSPPLPLSPSELRATRPRSVIPTPRLNSEGEPSSLVVGERAVLTAIAQQPSGATREQLTVLTGYKRSSRDTYLQRLRARALVDVAGDRLVASAAGVEALGTDFTPLPTGEELQRHWLARLPEGERRLFEILLAAYPNSLSRETLSTATGYKRSSRDTYLQRLRSRQLVRDTGRGDVRASEELFA